MYNLPKLQCINRGGCRMVAKNSKVPKFRNFGVLTGFGVSPGNPVKQTQMDERDKGQKDCLTKLFTY